MGWVLLHKGVSSGGQCPSPAQAPVHPVRCERRILPRVQEQWGRDAHTAVTPGVGQGSAGGVEA